MASRVPGLAPVREKAIGIAKRASSDIVDGTARDPRVSELQHDERREIATRLNTTTLDHLAPIGRSIQLLRDVFPNLERTDANVRTDRHHQLGRILRKRLHGPRNDTCDRTAPPRVHGRDMTALGMRDQNRDAIGRARCDPETLFASDQRIPFADCNRLLGVVEGDLPNVCAMHLTLLEQPIGPERDACGETRAIPSHGLRVVAQVEA